MIISQNVNKKLLNLNLDMVSRQELDYENLSDCIPLEEIRDNLLQSLRDKLNPAQRNILNYFVWAKLNQKIIHISQAKLALRLGYSREYINRCIKKLVAFGLVSSFYRHRNSCLYKLSSYFSGFYRMNSIKHLFSNIKNNIIKIASEIHDLKPNVTPLNISNYINKPSLSLHYLSNVKNAKFGLAKIENKNEFSSGSKILNSSYRSLGKMADSRSEIIDRLEIRLGLASEDKKRLEQFPIQNLLKAEYRLATATNLTDPVSYLFGMCFKMQREERGENLKRTNGTGQPYNPTKSYNLSPPQLTVEQRKSKEDKLFKEREEESERNKKSWEMNKNEAMELMKKALDNPNDYWRNLSMEILNKNLVIKD